MPFWDWLTMGWTDDVHEDSPSDEVIEKPKPKNLTLDEVRDIIAERKAQMERQKKETYDAVIDDLYAAIMRNVLSGNFQVLINGTVNCPVEMTIGHNMDKYPLEENLKAISSRLAPDRISLKTDDRGAFIYKLTEDKYHVFLIFWNEDIPDNPDVPNWLA